MTVPEDRIEITDLVTPFYQTATDSETRGTVNYTEYTIFVFDTRLKHLLARQYRSGTYQLQYLNVLDGDILRKIVRANLIEETDTEPGLVSSPIDLREYQRMMDEIFESDDRNYAVLCRLDDLYETYDVPRWVMKDYISNVMSEVEREDRRRINKLSSSMLYPVAFESDAILIDLSASSMSYITYLDILLKVLADDVLDYMEVLAQNIEWLPRPLYSLAMRAETGARFLQGHRIYMQSLPDHLSAMALHKLVSAGYGRAKYVYGYLVIDNIESIEEGNKIYKIVAAQDDLVMNISVHIPAITSDVLREFIEMVKTVSDADRVEYGELPGVLNQYRFLAYRNMRQVPIPKSVKDCYGYYMAPGGLALMINGTDMVMRNYMDRYILTPARLPQTTIETLTNYERQGYVTLPSNHINAEMANHLGATVILENNGYSTFLVTSELPLPSLVWRMVAGYLNHPIVPI